MPLSSVFMSLKAMGAPSLCVFGGFADCLTVLKVCPVLSLLLLPRSQSGLAPHPLLLHSAAISPKAASRSSDLEACFFSQAIIVFSLMKVGFWVYSVYNVFYNITVSSGFALSSAGHSNDIPKGPERQAPEGHHRVCYTLGV